MCDNEWSYSNMVLQINGMQIKYKRNANIIIYEFQHTM